MRFFLLGRKPRFIFWQVLTVLLLGAAGCRDSAQTPPMSFLQFHDLQVDYCTKVAEFLNTPIDWHMVIDVSGSYVSAAEPVDQILIPLVRFLPLEEGDSLTVDAFSDSLYRGHNHFPVTARWIDKVRSGQSVRADIEALFYRSDGRPPYPRETTDIASLFTGPKSWLALHAPHSPTNTRLYYIVLTDGRYDPEGKGSIPLFRDQRGLAPVFKDSRGYDTTFVDSLMRFVEAPEGNSRALYFVLDIAPLTLRGPDLTQRDWLVGMNEIDQIKKTEGQRAAFLHIDSWNPTTGRDLFNQEQKRQIGRAEGIYPCLVSADSSWKLGRWPTATGMPYPTFSSPISTIGPYVLEIPQPSEDKAYSPRLPLGFLVSEAKEESLSLALKEGGSGSGKGALIDSPKVEHFKPALNEPHSGWRAVFHFAEISVPEETSAPNPPWTTEVKFEGQLEAEPFIRVELQDPSMLRAAKIALISMNHHGKLFGLVALILWTCSLLLAWSYAEKVTLLVNITHEGKEISCNDQDGYGRRQFRFRHPRSGEEEIRPVVREDWPRLDWAEDDHVVFDVIPIFSVVYHLIYYIDRDRNIRHFADCELISLGEKANPEGLFGVFYKARASWCPIKWPWRPCSYQWRERLTRPGNRDSIYTIDTMIKEDTRSYSRRIISGILSYFTLLFSVAAIMQAQWRGSALAPVMLTCSFLVLVLYLLRYSPMPQKSRIWPKVDSFCTFSFYGILALAVVSAFVAKNPENRLTSFVLILVGCSIAVPLYEKMRDRLVKSRIANRQPIGVWDFLLEIFLARLCS